MAYLDGDRVEEHVLNEIKEYDERLKKRLDDNAELAKQLEQYDISACEEMETRDEYIMSFIRKPISPISPIPPFPLGEMYVDIVWTLNAALEDKKRSFVINFVTEKGRKTAGGSRRKETGEIEERKAYMDDPDAYMDDPDARDIRDDLHDLYYIATDKQFMELVNKSKNVFDRGFKHLIDAGYRM